MGTALGGGRGRGGARAGNPGQTQANAAELPGAVAAANARTPAAGAPPPEPTKPQPLPVIGPDGETGNVLYAWDPIARKERWRAPGAGAGPFSGGSLATAGNLVFSSVANRLMAFRADTGEKLLDLDLHMSQMGPPISFTIEGKQYISVTGGPQGGGGFGGGGGRSADKAGDSPAPPLQAAHLLVLALDGKAPIPGAPAN